MTSSEFIRQAVAESTRRTKGLPSGFRHNNGYICVGTLRVARADFDTDPSEAFRHAIFELLTKSANESEKKDAALLVAVAALERIIATHFGYDGDAGVTSCADAALDRMAELLKGDR